MQFYFGHRSSEPRDLPGQPRQPEDHLFGFQVIFYLFTYLKMAVLGAIEQYSSPQREQEANKWGLRRKSSEEDEKTNRRKAS